MPVSASDIRVREVPLANPDETAHRRQIASAVNQALRGRISAVLDVSLTVSPATSTVVTDERVSPSTAVLTAVLDAAGAGDITGIYVVPADGSFTIHHPANASARTLRCALLG